MSNGPINADEMKALYTKRRKEAIQTIVNGLGLYQRGSAGFLIDMMADFGVEISVPQALEMVNDCIRAYVGPPQGEGLHLDPFAEQTPLNEKDEKKE